MYELSSYLHIFSIYLQLYEIFCKITFYIVVLGRFILIRLILSFKIINNQILLKIKAKLNR